MRGWLGIFCLVGGLGAAGCRTQISSARPDKPPPNYTGERACLVQDFASATDVPEGSKSLGWVTARYTGNDEQTFIALRQKVCELGGDAMSQIAWVRETAEEKLVLKANAWSLP
jgi:hypothetical protein